MRSPRGCRSPCRFKVRAPNRFNWHLRPWTQHKSLRRAERGVGKESGGAITVSFVFATLCWGNFSTLNGSELTTIAMWARGREKFDKFRWTRMENLLDSARNSWVQSEKKRTPWESGGNNWTAQRNLTPLKMGRSGMGMFCDLPLQSSFNL